MKSFSPNFFFEFCLKKNDINGFSTEKPYTEESISPNYFCIKLSVAYQNIENTQIHNCYLELKKLGITKFNLMAIKWFLKFYYPEEYRLYSKYNDFERCNIKRHKVRDWVKSFIRKNSALPTKLPLQMK